MVRLFSVMFLFFTLAFSAIFLIMVRLFRAFFFGFDSCFPRQRRSSHISKLEKVRLGSFVNF